MEVCAAFDVQQLVTSGRVSSSAMSCRLGAPRVGPQTRDVDGSDRTSSAEARSGARASGRQPRSASRRRVATAARRGGRSSRAADRRGDGDARACAARAFRPQYDGSALSRRRRSRSGGRGAPRRPAAARPRAARARTARPGAAANRRCSTSSSRLQLDELLLERASGTGRGRGTSRRTSSGSPVARRSPSSRTVSRMKSTSSATTSSRVGSRVLADDLAQRPRVALRGAADHDRRRAGRREHRLRLRARRDVAARRSPARRRARRAPP